MREGERFTEEIGVLETLGGDEKDLQLPVHHVCRRCLYSSSIAGRLQFLDALQLQREIFRGSETTALSPWMATKPEQV